MEGVIFIVANLAQLKPFFSQNFLLVLKLVDDLYGNFISWPKNVESKYLFPARSHAVGPLNDLCMLYLVLPSSHLLIDYDLNHWLKAIRVKKLIIKLSIHDIEC